MGKKLTGNELEHQYHYRAGLLADLIGRESGSDNCKKAQRVFHDPNSWAMWTVSTAPLLPAGAKMVIKSPIHRLFLACLVFSVRYLDNHGMTLEDVQKSYKEGMKSFIEENDKGFDGLVDTEVIKKYDGRIGKDIEYGGNNSRNLHDRAKATLVSTLMDTPDGIGYPQVSGKIAEQPRWQQWLALKPGDSPIRVFWKAFRAGFTATTTNIRDIFSYLTARDIAREQGYNRGRLNPKTTNQLIDNGIVHKATTDENGNVDPETIVDQHSLDAIEHIESNGHDAIIEEFALKGIAYEDLTHKEWAEIFERRDLINNGYEFSSKNGVSMSSYYGEATNAKEKKWSRIKQKIHDLTINPE